MKKIRTVLPTTSNNDYIPNNVLALNVKDNNAYYRHNDSLFKIPLNDNDKKERYEEIIYGIKFKVLDKEVYEAHKDVLKGIYVEGIYSERVAYKITVVNHFDTGEQEIVYAESIENNKRWIPCLDGEGGVDDFRDVFPFCYMKKYINRGSNRKVELDKLIEFDNINITNEERENSDHYTALPVFFKSVAFPYTEWYNSTEDYDRYYAYYFISDRAYKVSLPSEEEDADAYDEEFPCLYDFVPVESHRILDNLALSNAGFMDNIFISSYNLNISDTGTRPGYLVKPVITESDIEFDYTNVIPHKIYETYLEFIWSIKLGTPCLQGYLNKILTDLYNKKINYLSYNYGFIQEQATETSTTFYYSLLYSYNFHIKIEKYNSETSRCKVSYYINFNIRDSNNKLIKITDPTALFNIVNNMFTENRDVALISLKARSIPGSLIPSIIKNKIVNVELISSEVVLTLEEEYEWEDSVLETVFISEFYLESGKTVYSEKDGLYNNIMVIDNIENPHIFSKYPTFIGSVVVKPLDVGVAWQDNNFMYNTMSRFVQAYAHRQSLAEYDAGYGDCFVVQRTQHFYSEHEYKVSTEQSIPSFINKKARFACNITGTQLPIYNKIFSNLNSMYNSSYDYALYLFRKFYYFCGFLDISDFWDGTYSITEGSIDQVFGTEINIEYIDSNDEKEHAQLIDPSIGVLGQFSSEAINFGLTRRILLEFDVHF